ncbi:MAG TPA: ATP-binding protein [Flavisolibacter sp.]|nr:ATP-binding protein [Flavisolibacter sp.]
MITLFYAAVASVFIIAGCSERDEAKPAKASRDFQAGQYYDYYQKKDSAFYYYNRVIQNATDSLEKATAYFKMGLWQLDAGDYYSAQESLLSSIKTLDKEDSTHYQNLSASYNTLANATLNLKDYESAIRNYHLALNFATERDSRLYVFNNLGVAYQKSGDYYKAIPILDSAAAQRTSDTSLKAMLLSNAVRTKWLADSNFSPLPGFFSALALRRLINDSLGMNASFAHLSDYYRKSRPDSALYYALKRLEIAENLADPNDRLEALNQLIKVAPPERTKRYMEEYLRLNDSLATIRSRDRNQFALIRFDAERSKADNLLLEKHIARQNLIIGGIVLLAAAFILTLWILSRIKRKRLSMEAEKAIQKAKLQTSQKVHDVVANGLYRIMNELEHREIIERESLLDSVETLYEKSRNISYEDSDTEDSGYRQHIHQLLASFTNFQTKIIVSDKQETFWNRLTTSQKRELELVLEEILVNMQKHSHATAVEVCFSQQGDRGYVAYNDNGVGFGPNHRVGNGLRSTVNRIKSINGEIRFAKSRKGGASVEINFPLEPITL